MRRPCSLLVVGGVFGLFLSLFPSVAQAATCSSVCTSTASCSLSCTAIGGGEPEMTTCGEWGRCAYPPPPPPPPTCTSNWVITGSVLIGAYSAPSFAPSGCYNHQVYRVTRHDTNGCKPDQIYCEVRNSTFQANPNSCCGTYLWCGGDTCGFH